MNVLVVGGTRGLGFEIAKCCVREGDTVAVAGRSVDSTVSVALPSVHRVVMDVANPDDHPARWVDFDMTARDCDIIVWTAGTWLNGRFFENDESSIEELIATHLTGMLLLLRRIVAGRVADRAPVHLVIISSSSSWKARSEEAVYGAVQAAKAQFARNLGVELPRDIPGSKVTLVCPGGMQTRFFEGKGVDTSTFMDPAKVAAMVVGIAKAQTEPYSVAHIAQIDGVPTVTSVQEMTPQHP